MLAAHFSAMGHSLLLPALDLDDSISISFDGPTLHKVTMGKRTLSLSHILYFLA